MASQLASGNLISDRYASALYDLASEKKVVDFVLENLQSLKKTIDNNKELSLLVRSPLISSNDKLEVLLKLASSLNLTKLSITSDSISDFSVLNTFNKLLELRICNAVSFNQRE